MVFGDETVFDRKLDRDPGFPREHCSYHDLYARLSYYK